MDLLEKMRKSQEKPKIPDSQPIKIPVVKKPIKRVSTTRKSKEQAKESIIKNLTKYFEEIPIEKFWSMDLTIKALHENRKTKRESEG